MVSKSYNRKYQNTKSAYQRKARMRAHRSFSKLAYNVVRLIRLERPFNVVITEKRFNSTIKGLCSLWLAEKLNMSARECRFSTMSVSKCCKAIKLCTDSHPRTVAEWIKSKICLKSPKIGRQGGDLITVILLKTQGANNE